MIDKEIIQIKTRELYHLLLVKDVDILFAHRLLHEVYNVICYRYQFHAALTPEAESLARWSLRDAKISLDMTLCEMDLCDLDKKLVRYVADYTEFEKK